MVKVHLPFHRWGRIMTYQFHHHHHHHHRHRPRHHIIIVYERIVDFLQDKINVNNNHYPNP